MSTNTTIAKNTLFLYFRMLFTLGIGLYTSRLVLDVLGVVDYGIYNIVGGVVGILSFMHVALSGATTRFLNITKVSDATNLKAVFNTSIILHFCLAVVVLLLAETIGIWLFYNKLVIPADRVDIAFWVYQISIISILFTIMQIPYDAAMIAHEKMNIYAYLSILEAALKMVVVIIVSFLSLDKLLWYAILILVLSIGIRLVYQMYCRRHFEECKFSFLFDKNIFRQMFSFFGWDLYGNMCVVFRLQGTNVFQNMFFGPLVNASVAIVSQAQGGLMSLSSNFTLAAKPQMIQSYAKHDYERLIILLQKGTKLAFYLVMVFAIPLAFNSKFILELWLKEVPPYAEQFLQLSLLSTVMSVSFALLNPVIHATGKMFLISFVTGSVYLLALPVIYVLFRYGFSPVTPYYLSFLIVVLTGFINLLVVQKYISIFSAINFIKIVLLKMYVIFFMLIFLGVLQQIYAPIHPFLSLCLLFITSCLTVFLLGLTKNERHNVSNIIKEKFKR